MKKWKWHIKTDAKINEEMDRYAKTDAKVNEEMNMTHKDWCKVENH